MPGEELVVAPHNVARRSLTIKWQAEDVWPRLVRVGCRTAGFYAYDRIGRLRGIRAGPG
jgi:hypothetical protein